MFSRKLGKIEIVIFSKTPKTVLLISQQPNNAQSLFLIQNERQDYENVSLGLKSETQNIFVSVWVLQLRSLVLDSLLGLKEFQSQSRQCDSVIHHLSLVHPNLVLLISVM